MKNKVSGIILAAVAFFCVINSAWADGILLDTLTVIHNRKSVRNFTGKTVSREDLITIVKAGMAAPTAVNMQPWSFVIITERPALDSLSEALPYAKMLDRAGAAIVVCAIPEKAFQEKLELAVIDSCCASENILLAVEALGLGAVWTGVYPEKERMDVVRKQLNIPEKVIPLNVIPIGYPASGEKPRDKFKQGNIHWQRW